MFPDNYSRVVYALRSLSHTMDDLGVAWERDSTQQDLKQILNDLEFVYADLVAVKKRLREEQS